MSSVESISTRLFVLLVLAGLLQVCAQSAQPGRDEYFQLNLENDLTQWEFINVATLAMNLAVNEQNAWLIPAIGYDDQADSFSELAKVYYYQHTMPISVLPEEGTKVIARVGNTSTIYIVPESYSGGTRWQIRVSQLFNDGSTDQIAYDSLSAGSNMYVNVLPDSRIEIEISQESSERSYTKQLWLTIVPEYEVLGYIPSATLAEPVSLHQ
jgi:hypothetical protein